MCDWPVYGVSGYTDRGRMCDFNGIHRVGPLDVCALHFGTLVTGMVDAMRRQADQMIAEGRRTPGGIEEEVRWALSEINKKRRPALYQLEGRQACVYFAEREGYVKIGSTVDLATRMRALASGSSMLSGTTAGPLTLLATVPGGIDEEKAFHKRFRRLRVDRNREWFLYQGKLREFVEELQSAAA